MWPLETGTSVGESNEIGGTKLKPEKTALVLSAGGMFGAYQAGVWAALANFFDPDIVVGASVGSLNAYLIASGCSPELLISRWLNMPGSRVSWRVPSSPFDGCIDSADFEQMLQQMCSQWTPRKELGIVATSLPRVAPRLFRSPDIQWQHLAASCAVPFFLRHHRLEGQWHSDGGLLDPLPLWAAVEMGATRAIAVNLLEHRPWIVRFAVRTLRAYSPFRADVPHTVEVIRISPRSFLGSVRDSIYWDRARAERWIEQGRNDAIVSLAASGAKNTLKLADNPV